MSRPVAVVTGGGGGIGAAIAEELGRRGHHVVTVDPLVTLDGAAQLPAPEQTTAGRIEAAGGSAVASNISVTDGRAVRDLFAQLVAEHGRLDAVINVAGITRPTSFIRGTEDDWMQLLSVHLDGYLNVLRAALPLMAAAGRGRVLGVTSGSGWRPADVGAYGCAKRAVAALTWQLGRRAPPGVTVNAISPIAVTRMVTAALARAQPAGASPSSATGGLSLGGMPEPHQLGPIGAHLVGDDMSWCNGRVIFTGGSEVAVIDEPRPLEIVRGDGVPVLADVLESVAGALAAAEAGQASTGGSNPRFGAIFDEQSVGDLPIAEVRSCVVVTDRDDVGAAAASALEARGVAVTTAAPGPRGFAGAASTLAAAVERAGPVDAVVVALAGGALASGAPSTWERILAEHDGIVGQIGDDAGWARAVADHAAAAGRAIRLVTVTDAVGAGGRSRAQAAAQLARASRKATKDAVAAFAVGAEGTGALVARPLGELVAHLLCSPDAVALSGAELVAAPGWLGLRSHPRPSASITFGGPEVPKWFNAALRSIVGASEDDG